MGPEGITAREYRVGTSVLGPFARDSSACLQVALNDVLTATTPRFAWCLVEHSFLNTLVRLHQRWVRRDSPGGEAVQLLQPCRGGAH